MRLHPKELVSVQRTLSHKRPHFGMAGHYAAMSELLLRGYNVAIPSIDVGDDVLVIDDNRGTVWRVQVKTGEPRRATFDSGKKIVHYNLSRKQLREVKSTELWFMFMVRWEHRWRFVFVSRDRLDVIRDRYVVISRKGNVGAKPKPDAMAKTDVLALDITWTADNATGWMASLKDCMDVWPTAFPDLRAVPQRSAALLPPAQSGIERSPRRSQQARIFTAAAPQRLKDRRAKCYDPTARAG